MVVVTTDQGSDSRAAHHHRRHLMIRPEVPAITVNLHEQVCRCFLNMGFVHGKTPDIGSQTKSSPVCSAFNISKNQHVGFVDER